MRGDAAAKRQVRPQEVREAVLGAAVGAFADRGFDGASTRQIAAAAGVSQQLLTHHFPSKQLLWESAVTRLFDAFSADLRHRYESLGGGDRLARAKEVLRHFVRLSAEHPELHRLVLEEAKVDGPRLRWMIEHWTGDFYRFVTAVCEPLQEAGQMRPIPPPFLYYMVVGCGASVFSLAPECRQLSGRDPSDTGFVEEQAEQLIALLFDPWPASG